MSHVLTGQTVVVIGGSSGIGLEIARRVREEGAAVIITARDADRLHRAGLELKGSIAAFDATDFDRLKRFFDELPAPVDHVLVTCAADRQLSLPQQLARNARSKIRPGGALLFAACTDDRRAAVSLSALTRNLALELAPVRVNLIAVSSAERASPADLAAIALHLMSDTAITGATSEFDGGQQLFDA